MCIRAKYKGCPRSALFQANPFTFKFGFHQPIRPKANENLAKYSCFKDVETKTLIRLHVTKMFYRKLRFSQDNAVSTRIWTKTVKLNNASTYMT